VAILRAANIRHVAYDIQLGRPWLGVDIRSHRARVDQLVFVALDKGLSDL
jgi:hypothetical protein